MDQDQTRRAGSVPRETVSLDIDSDVLDRLRSLGPDWRERINDILRNAVHPQDGDGMRPEELNAENDG